MYNPDIIVRIVLISLALTSHGAVASGIRPPVGRGGGGIRGRRGGTGGGVGIDETSSIGTVEEVEERVAPEATLAMIWQYPAMLAAWSTAIRVDLSS